MHQFESHISIYEALDEAKNFFNLSYQGPRTSNTQHVKNIHDMVDIIKYHESSITEDKTLIEHGRKVEENYLFLRDPLRKY